MNKREFALKMIGEIEQIAKLGFHYQAFALLAILDSFLSLECNINVFTLHKIKRGFSDLRNFYVPRKAIWLMSELTSNLKHTDSFKGIIALDIFKTIEDFKTIINNTIIEETPYLEIEDDEVKDDGNNV